MSLRRASLWALVPLLAACGPEPSPTPEGGSETGGTPSTTSEASPLGLVDVTAKRGLPAAEGVLPDGTYKLMEMLGAGTGLVDLDKDGRLDLLQPTRRMPWGTGDPLPHLLWMQQPDGTFAEESEARGLVDTSDGVGLAIADFDADGNDDVWFANFGQDRLFRGRPDGTFSDQTEASRMTSDDFAVTACPLDYDRDGDLDLFVVNYVRFDPNTTCNSSGGQEDYCGPDAFDPWPDVLFANDGKGVFADVTEAAGVAKPGSGLGVLALDLTLDGWLDVYVTNDMRDNHLWVNQADGTFTEEAVLRGIGVSGEGRPEASMGVAALDFNADGRLDLYMTHIQGQTNTVYMSVRDGIWVDGTAKTGMGKFDTRTTGFGCVFFDLEHDGDEDLFVANGRVYRQPTPPASDLGDFWSSYGEADQFYVNDGNARFEEVPSDGGSLLGTVRVTRGASLGDLDSDGDLDLVIHAIGNRVRVFENRAAKGHWLSVSVSESYGLAYGAQVTLVDGDSRSIRAFAPSSSYASWNEPRLHFGLGARTAYDALEVRWPDGTLERFPGGSTNRRVDLVRGNGETR